MADDRFYRFLERTWMLQQLPPALLLYAAGGWAFVVWGTCARVTAGVFGQSSRVLCCRSTTASIACAPREARALSP